MRKIFINFLIPLCVFLTVGGVASVVSLPKAVLLDKLLGEADIHILTRRVEENLRKVIMEGVRIFKGNSEIAHLDKLNLSLTLSGLKLKGTCGEGRLEGFISYRRNLELSFDKFSCIERVGELSGEVAIRDGIFGTLNLKGIMAQGVEIESAELKFTGEKFEGVIKAMGMTFRGGGTIKVNRENPAESEIDALFKGDLGRVIVRGKLSSISVHVR